MKGGKLRLLFCSVPEETIQVLLDLLRSEGYAVDYASAAPDSCDMASLLLDSWDAAVVLVHESDRDYDSHLPLLNSLNPSLPIVLLHDAACEGHAARLLAEDAQVQQCIATNDLASFPKKLAEQLDLTPHVATPVTAEQLSIAPEQYRQFVEVAREGIWVIDAEGTTTYVNPAMAKMLGYRVEEMIGKHLFAFMDEQGIEICKRNMKRREQGIDDQHDFELVRKDGARIYTTMETSPILEDGVYKGGIAGVIDITAKYQAEQILRHVNRALRTTRECVERIVRATEEHALLDDICQSIVTTGGYRMAWIGYAEKEAGKRVYPVAQSGVSRAYLEQLEITWSDSVPTGRGPTGTAIRTGKASVVREINKEDRFAPWRAAARECGFASSIALPLHSGDDVLGALNIYSATADAFDTEEQQLLQELADDLSFGIIALRDHSARLQAEAELKQYQEHLEELVSSRTAELQRSNQELESFSYTVSHDLRAPLRHINGYCNLLAEDYGDKLDGEARQYLQRMQAATRRMGDLIDHMLTLGRLNQQDVQREPVNLSDMVNGIIRHLKERYPQGETETVVAADVIVTADRKMISVVLQNLLDNAWKFTRQSAHPRVEFGVTYDTGETVYYVKDNGVGFDMRYVNTLFRTFQRLHSNDDYEGTGIGLASVQSVIERHGGRVWAEAEEGKGATFCFTLPG